MVVVFRWGRAEGEGSEQYGEHPIAYCMAADAGVT